MTKRGEIWIMSFDPAVGSEIKKTLPALIVQNDIGNEHSPLTIVLPLTSNPKRGNLINIVIHSPEGGLEVDSVVLTNQIRAIDKQRLIKKLGKLKPETLDQVDYALQISLGLIKL
jgi:mRNA interferase MazF